MKFKKYYGDFEIYNIKTGEKVPNNKHIKTTARQWKTLEKRLLDRMNELFESRKYFDRDSTRGPYSHANSLIWEYKRYAIREVKDNVK